MALPWPLLWLIDPAGAYWARQEPPARGPVPRRVASYGPLVPGSPRHRTGRGTGAPRHTRDVPAARAVDLHTAAERVLADGAVTVAVDGRTIEARVVRFWRGDALLETTTGGSSSRTRIPRRAEPGLVLAYLARAAERG